MKESHGKDPASHPDPESCVGDRKGAGEVLTGAHVGQPSSCEIKSSGMVAAIMGARAKAGSTSAGHNEDKEAAEKKKRTSVSAESFDHQVADKMGAFFTKTFLPAIKKLVKAGRSYPAGSAQEMPGSTG